MSRVEEEAASFLQDVVRQIVVKIANARNAVKVIDLRDVMVKTGFINSEGG
jgi:hypothetical protein